MPGIIPLDEFPLHQAPLPLAYANSSDRNFYDRWYFQRPRPHRRHHAGHRHGLLPNLGTKDAFVLVALQRPADRGPPLRPDGPGPAQPRSAATGSRSPSRCTRSGRPRGDRRDGARPDLGGTCPVVQSSPHVLRSGSRVTLDAQRFAQLGTWSGTIAIDGEDIAVDPSTWLGGSRDRSWGIRPVGEAEPPGRQPTRPSGHGWLYVPMQFGDFAVVVIIQESPRRVPHAQRLHPGLEGRRVEQLGWPLVGSATPPARGRRPARRSGARPPRANRSSSRSSRASPYPPRRRRLRRRPGLDPRHVEGRGLRRAGHLRHGRRRRAGVSCSAASTTWAGALPCRRRRRRGGRPGGGFGLFEHFCIGRHDPSGFTDFFTSPPTGGG